MRVLVSVHDKSGLAEFAQGLAGLGAELVASGGTAAFLEEHGLEVTSVEELTEVPELLGGRVKTLHPRVHAAILARHEDDLSEHSIEPFDLVCVNLYPFESDPGVELVDVGGPAMLRGAAKNFARVVAVSRPDQYDQVLAELREGGEVAEETRRRLAAEAFAATARYDTAIAAWLAGRERLGLVFERERQLAYGENPHQRAAYYVEPGKPHLLSGVEQLHGRELSFNNLNDLAGAVRLARELDGPACVIVKHANPCGVAVADTVEQAYERALGADPVSAYGGVVVLTRQVTAPLGEALARQFVEVLLAPGYETLAPLAAKPNVRILAGALAPVDELDLKRVPGGLLVQDADVSEDELEPVCGEPTEAQRADLEFAWTVCKHVASNAIVLAKDGRTIGIGAGQMSRVDAVRIAVEKAREHGHELAGAVLASDAFFPFADGPRLALEAGVAAIVQPGGSKRDEEVVAAVREAGAAMAFTDRRHFRH
ncbi:MAG: bifunctional phosphoribosylaminoimidazolecarboxamide formyltransferase/IMP cyclohydrolase [Thermoleophilia bacterium]|nr:bifunctional phosphoribosylaminoimidazolecarboxamide formyltransferase/IMP cyclohydrolase [Thermoleophilia bacterium]